MNEKSVLCRLIAEQPDTWREKLKALDITVKEEGNLAIFNYGMGCDFADPIVQESRGIILDLKQLEVVCWPFRKFGNSTESYADPIDWSSARVQDKIDGSIVKLWYDRKKQQWGWSTNGVIRAEDARNKNNLSFLYMIEDAVNYADIRTDALDPEKTYIFEMVHPQNQIVVYYDVPKLYHTGTRNNRTGEETVEDIGIEKPAEYQLHSLDDCIEAVKALNEPDAEVKKEGFVVVDGNWNRVKVKSPEYFIQHRLASEGRVSKEGMLKLIMDPDFDLSAFCEEYPEYTVHIRYYQYKLAELFALSEEMANYARQLYEEFSRERKAVALKIVGHPYSKIGFWALDHPDTPAKEFWELSKLTAAIPDYEPVSVLRM